MFKYLLIFLFLPLSLCAELSSSEHKFLDSRLEKIALINEQIYVIKMKIANSTTDKETAKYFREIGSCVEELAIVAYEVASVYDGTYHLNKSQI